MGTKDGSIIATIITTHIPRNDAAVPGHVCPGIRIHAIDIVQPPGIGIPPIADMDAHQTIVTAALAAKSSANTPKNARWETMRLEISLKSVVVIVFPFRAVVRARSAKIFSRLCSARHAETLAQL